MWLIIWWFGTCNKQVWGIIYIGNEVKKVRKFLTPGKKKECCTQSKHNWSVVLHTTVNIFKVTVKQISNIGWIKIYDIAV